MTTFSLVAQSLRTAEPMHQVIPTSLLDRLLYHQQHQYHSRSYESRADAVDQIDIAERIKSLDFVFFATGIAAVSQIISVRDRQGIWYCILFILTFRVSMTCIRQQESYVGRCLSRDSRSGRMISTEYIPLPNPLDLNKYTGLHILSPKLSRIQYIFLVQI